VGPKVLKSLRSTDLRIPASLTSEWMNGQERVINFETLNGSSEAL
jgi:hypothetical protein